MRRFITLAFAVALVAALVAPASAQSVLAGPGGLITTSTASAAVTNTTTATSIFSYVVPAGMTQGAFAPLHLRLVGRLTTNASAGGVGTVNLGCNYGGTAASIALSNGLAPTANLTAQPIAIDVWLSGYSTRVNGINGWIQGRMEYAVTAATAATAPVILAAGADSSTSPGTVNTLACTWQWASASATNSLVITNTKLIQGD